MKKVLALSLCAAIVLTGCGGAGSAGTTAAGEKKSGTEEKKLVLSTYGLSEDIS